MSCYVITASVYVDEVASPEDATAQVERLNEMLDDPAIQIQLPDNDSDHKWEWVGD